MEHEKLFRVDEDTQLLPFLLAQFPGRGRNKVKALLTRGQVMVDGEVVTRHDRRLGPGAEVAILATGAVKRRELMAGIKLVYEDDAVMVIDKPPGLLSIATEDERERTAYHILTDYVRERDREAKVFIVHRLDRDTSGLMMFAKTAAAKQQLQGDWENAVVERAYSALVEGLVRDDEGSIDTWLKESVTKTMYVSRQGDGMRALTRYKVRTRSPAGSPLPLTLLDVRLETGRKNQIRVHLQSIGHSVVGDKRYGAQTNPIGRLGLHARVLAFKHPMTGRVLRFETPIPSEFKAAVAARIPAASGRSRSHSAGQRPRSQASAPAGSPGRGRSSSAGQRARAPAGSPGRGRSHSAGQRPRSRAPAGSPGRGRSHSAGQRERARSRAPAGSPGRSRSSSAGQRARAQASAPRAQTAQTEPR